MQTSANILSVNRANVLGMGPSLEQFIEHKPKGITIGVNDIFSKIKCDYVVCADRAEKFSFQRAEIIRSCTPKKFYSHLEEWRAYHASRFEKLNITGMMDASQFTNWNALPRGFDSTYIACIIAYHLGAREIVLWGADFIGHPHLGTESKLKLIRKRYAELRDEMKKKDCELLLGGTGGALSGILSERVSG